MRVSDNSMIRNFLTNLEQVRERVARRSNEVSSGKKITRPSQDPVGTARLLRLRDSMAQINQHSRNAQRVEVKRDSFSGVSLDEEAVNMIQYQRSFQATARVMRTLDELLEETMNLIR